MTDNFGKIADIVFESYPTVRRACRSLVSLKSLPLSMTQLVCLYTIERMGNPTMSDLAKKMQISNQQLTKIVDALAELQLAERTIDSGNRRRIMASVTEKGARALNAIRSEALRKLTLLTKKFSEEEMNKLFDSCLTISLYVEKLQEVMDKHGIG